MGVEMVGRTLSHYRVLEEISRGGMGVVYRALDLKLNREVALKVLPPELLADEERKARFIQEARAAAALYHPHIATVFEIEEADGALFIAMELIAGEKLRALLSRERLPLARALSLVIEVAEGLGRAHQKGVVHRDLKPENIMVTEDGHAKIIDFGLAKLLEPWVSGEGEAETAARFETESGRVMGTVSYMSPEQARGEKVDQRSDIFTLGVVLYELVTGGSPFLRGSAAETLSAILKEAPRPLDGSGIGASADTTPRLQRVLDKCLAKDPEGRYQTSKDLVLDLKWIQQGSGSEVSVSVEKRLARIGAPKLWLVATMAALASAAALYVFFFQGHKSIESLAVLPFGNVGADPNTEYLADGIPESIINSLSQLPNLKVMSRNSVFSFKGHEINAREVGQKLGVQAVLIGRVAQRGDSLAISLELVDARDNSQIWGQQYNRKLADLFAVQEEMAKEISEKLRLQLTGAERQQLAKRPTENLKAFQYYMQGRSYVGRRTRADILAAIRYYERAIEEDRNYALAYAGLADAYITLGAYGYTAPVEGRRKAEEAAGKALALDESLAEAHVALGLAYIAFAPSDFSRGDRELRRALELSPSLAWAHLYLGLSLVRQGHLDEGSEEHVKARELDPLSSIMARQLAVPYYLKRDHVRALELLRQANELGPPFSTTWEIGVFLQNRLFNETLAELEKAKQERKNDPILIYGTGMVYAAQGKRAEALQISQELEEMSGPSLSEAHWIAKIYATLNEKELAFSWLERGLAGGAIGYFYKDEPVWDPIRSDPRFADLLRRMGIPP